MTEQTPTTTEQAPTAEQTTTEPTEPTTETAATADPEGLGDAGKRAIAAERQARADAEQQLRTVTEQLTAANDRVNAFEAANTTLTSQVESLALDNTRLAVAIDKGLPKTFVSRLQGTDEASFAADADALLALVPQTGRISPKPDPSAGPRTPVTPDPATQFAAVLGDALRKR